MDLTAHFRQNWKDRVGGDPDPVVVDEILDRSVVIARAKRFRLFEGNWFSTLSYFWEPEKNIVITADELGGKLVSVLTPEVLPRRIRQHYNAKLSRSEVIR